MRPLASAAALCALVAALLGSTSPVRADWPDDPAVNLLVGSPFVSDAPQALPDGSGGMFVFWADVRVPLYAIYMQHVLADGRIDPTWPVDGRAVVNFASDQFMPRVVGDGAGGAIVVWEDERNGSDDIYALRVLPTGFPHPDWPASGRALCTAGGDQEFATIVSDGAGGALVAWHDFRAGNYDIYATRVLANGTVDPAWPVNGRALCTATNSQVYPDAVSDGSGGLIVAWQDARVDPSFDVYAMRVLSNGSLAGGWPINGRALCNLSGIQQYVQAVPDGAGGAIVSWPDLRVTTPGLYAQRILSSGAVDPAWTANGRPIETAAGAGAPMDAVSTGSGVAYLAWVDPRGGTFDAYVQRVTTSGVDPAWPVNGLLVGVTTGDQSSPVLLDDGAGGIFVVWMDQRNGGPNYDLYATHVLSTGAFDPNWPAGGRELSRAPGTQQLPSLVRDGAGGLLAAWLDDRNFFGQIYAGNIEKYGYYGSPQADIVGVLDVPNDQGGKVKVSWDASYLDPLGSTDVAYYDILRSVPSSLVTEPLRTGARPLVDLALAGSGASGGLFAAPAPNGVDTYYWELIASTPALRYLSHYSYTAATTGDSTAGGNPYTAFMVVAHNATLTRFWLSFPDSGYSVDDLAPDAPNALTALASAGTTRLSWQPNAEADLAFYRLYRGADLVFVPGPGNLLAEPPDTGYVDPVSGPFVYKLSAVDVHGNESPVAVAQSGGVVAIEDPAPRALAFRSPVPNPASEASLLAYALPRAGHVRLSVYDAAGRLVRVLSDGWKPAGEHAERWNLRDSRGADVAPGLYFVRLEAGDARIARRLAITR